MGNTINFDEILIVNSDWNWIFFLFEYGSSNTFRIHFLLSVKIKCIYLFLMRNGALNIVWCTEYSRWVTQLWVFYEQISQLTYCSEYVTFLSFLGWAFCLNSICDNRIIFRCIIVQRSSIQKPSRTAQIK